ncbi:unnamed protein product [Ostreobium quekettii]|uniref:HMG box domain-containing protein n=1 Tax=Ostreobium quekettii TaxID=121088 RepID=A0A8S1JCA2_9CHLO|nr:unnamed protein product [Ostreobium quekettii]
MASAVSQLNVAAFYGADLNRPYRVIDSEDGIRHRANEPEPVTRSLLEWAEETPFKSGGLVVKPRWVGDPPRQARNAFRIFEDEEGASLVAPGDTSFRAVERAARGELKKRWKSLAEKERRKFEELAEGDQLRYAAELKAFEQKNPEYAILRERAQKNKKPRKAPKRARRRNAPTKRRSATIDVSESGTSSSASDCSDEEPAEEHPSKDMEMVEAEATPELMTNSRNACEYDGNYAFPKSDRRRALRPRR